MPNMTALERCKHFGVANLQGIAYMPGPTNYTKTQPAGSLYENSDFYNNIFEELWGCLNPNGMGERGRRDLYRFRQQLGVNFIHCYDWAAPISQKDQNGKLMLLRQHTGFLRVCHDQGMKATVPISNYTMMLLSQNKIAEARKNVEEIISEVYSVAVPPNSAPIPGVGMWKIFNEYELWWDKDPAHVVTVMTWIAEWEGKNNILDQNALPVMVCTSFGVEDNIPGAGYLKKVRDVLLQRGRIGNHDSASFWNERIVFATNPQNPGSYIRDYLANSLPNYWKRYDISAPPVMFTELGSSIEQTGGEAQQAEWLLEQIAASKPGSSNGMMLGACVFLNEERPWEAGAEKTFGLMRFGPDSSWGFPKQNFQADTTYPQWDPSGWWWPKAATYPVEQQAPKLSYRSVARAWGQQ
ncbi:hypothetical protein [Bradyrhizobium sp. WSM2793]|uniref:hypothetical protein n=1 Tax=Bradyrhizobium sp. WSM2793 TaxID=1038866 RepID=UPI0003A3383E|nr:hypothetical protein [Bradyrhizobium sp. WSM2793]